MTYQVLVDSQVHKKAPTHLAVLRYSRRYITLDGRKVTGAETYNSFEADTVKLTNAHERRVPDAATIKRCNFVVNRLCLIYQLVCTDTLVVPFRFEGMMLHANLSATG